MSALILDNYNGYAWDKNPEYSRIINVVKSRKFQPPRKIVVNPAKCDSLENICASRVNKCQNTYRSIRSYKHNSYEYDTMNELERFGAGKYARRYILIISFEDSLDFIYSCLYRTKLGSLIEFCNKSGIDYKSYSRQHLAGGKYGETYLTDLFGFSPIFDDAINTIGSDDSINRRIYFNNLTSFCMDFRNAMLLYTGDLLGEKDCTVLASAGITSAVYYSDSYIDGDITVRYKMYETRLKILCVEYGKYFDSIHESLCS